MTGAPNCQNPVWSPEEETVVRRAWSAEEAWRDHCAMFAVEQENGHWGSAPVPTRTKDAVRKKWEATHPKIVQGTGLDLRLKRELDRLEAMG